VWCPFSTFGVYALEIHPYPGGYHRLQIQRGKTIHRIDYCLYDYMSSRRIVDTDGPNNDDDETTTTITTSRRVVITGRHRGGC
jgi:hypothetical protein